MPSRGPSPSVSLSGGIAGHTDTSPRATRAEAAHLLRELGGPQQLQGLQVGVEERAGLQAAPQLALHYVAHGAVVGQPDARRGVHEVVAAGDGASYGCRPAPSTPRGLPPPRRPSSGAGWRGGAQLWRPPPPAYSGTS